MSAKRERRVGYLFVTKMLYDFNMITKNQLNTSDSISSNFFTKLKIITALKMHKFNRTIFTFARTARLVLQNIKLRCIYAREHKNLYLSINSKFVTQY